MTTVWLDFETRSRCDLVKHGSYNYAAHESTEIVIASWAVGMGPIRRWSRIGASVPVIELRRVLNDPDTEIRAHNASFERLLLKHCWKMNFEPERFFCTAFQARSCSLPGALADLGPALASKMKKDPRGYQLIRLLSIPREDGTFNEDPDLYREFGEYCDHDVKVMRHFSLTMPPLDDMSRRVYAANEAVNDRGLPVDRELCTLALGYAERESAEAQAKVERLTEGACPAARGTRLTQWLHDNLPPQAARLMEVMKPVIDPVNVDETKSKYAKAAAPGGRMRAALTLNADTRAAIFALAEESPEEFDPDALAVLEANDAVTSTSVYKFRRMLEMTSPDGRLRGAFVPGGASGTGRFSSHGCQLHNFPRVTHKDPEAAKALMRKGADLGGPVMEILKSLLRAAICPGKGRVIVRSDWNAIEARALPWLTGRASAVVYMDAFNDPNRDIYREQAVLCGLGENRQAGKVVVLALGYGGSVGALAAMSKSYGVIIEGAPKTIVDAWRRANPWAPEFWNESERAARSALAVPLWSPAGRVGWSREKPGEIPGLRMMLPSGRLIHYPFATIDEEGIGYLKAAWKPRKDAPEWPRARLWGGLAVENATQGCAADLLREALVAAVEAGLPICGHVHDELIAEASVKDAPAVGIALHNVMLQLPDWAKGLPLAAETDISPRYRK